MTEKEYSTAEKLDLDIQEIIESISKGSTIAKELQINMTTRKLIAKELKKIWQENKVLFKP